MNEEKFVQSNTQYLELAKEVTTSLHDLCIESKDSYNLVTVLAAVSIGFYMFLREIAQNTELKFEELLDECYQWINWADSKLNKLN